METKNNYELKEIEDKGYILGVIKYKYFKVLNYDGNVDKLKQYVSYLNEVSMFNIDYYIHKIEENEAIIEEVIDTLY